MRKNTVICVVVFVIGMFFIYGCGKFDSSSSTGGGGGGNPPLTTASLFNVSGATAIAAASGATTSTSAIKTMSAQNITELLKLNSAGKLTSVLSTALAAKWHPPISVIETGPDGALYIGFQWGIWVSDNSTMEAGNSAAFFKVAADGTTTIVDDDIYGVGSWYGGSENGELPVKQIQWDSDGNLYYIGKNTSGNSMLKKKTVAGVISQIGSSNYEVRDFLVAGNLVFFHGSNVGNWSIEWLRVIKDSSVSNIFYNDGQGWLRAYYKDNSNNVYLVGENLTLLDANDVPQKYSGIIKVTLTSTGTPSAVAALYDDKNMYSDSWGTIGDQLVWGYWDPVDQEQKYFFARDTYNQIRLPLSFEAGVTEGTVRTYIRQKYQSTTLDNLNNLTLEGHTATTTLEPWQVTNWLNDIVPTYINGATWTTWKRDNDLQNVHFGNAKQLLFSAANELYAVMRLDSWGTGSSRGDKLFKIVNSSGEAKPIAYKQDTATHYKTMSKARLYGNYCVYLSNKVGKYKIFRLDLTNSAALPVDMIPSRSNIEIFGFNFNETNSKLYYDVYDLSNNTSYLAQQDIGSTTGATEVSAEGYTITEVVPFTGN